MIIEFARNVLGVRDAEHEETQPGAPRLAVTALACSLAGQDHAVRLLAGTRVASLYDVPQAVEPFFCSYGLNPEYRTRLEARGLIVSGVGQDDEVRVMELADHPFFIGTLYVPQARSRPGEPHPLCTALASAARHATSRPEQRTTYPA
jgi:CTP synthase (UTP-ammonia lyase)